MTRITFAVLASLLLASPALAFGGGAVFELPTLDFPSDTSTSSTQGSTAPACDVTAADQTTCK